MVTTINTVADLKKVLSVYDESLPIKFFADGKAVRLGTDLSVFAVIQPNTVRPLCVMIELHGEIQSADSRAVI